MRSSRILAALGATLALAACSTTANDAPSVPSGTANTQDTEEPGSSPAAEPSTLTILSGGDILLHPSINEAAWTGETYDYTPLFAGVQPWIEGADLALCSLEVPIVPPGDVPSGYPLFAAPPEIVYSMKAMGWDGCAVANNHSMDKGFEGVVSTADTFDAAGMGFHGIARTAEEAKQIQYYTLEAGGRTVTIAHLASTTITNGIPLREDEPWSWNVIGEFGLRSVEDVIADARRAREAGADLVVLSQHWGTEYVSEPIDEQIEIADKIAASGTVDLIFGNHSHVPEPITRLEGGPDGKGMWVVWSMGNLISGQLAELNGYRVVAGLMTTATVEVPAEGPAHVTNLEWTVVAKDSVSRHIFLLNELLQGSKPAGLAMDEYEIQSRADVTYPVMEADGSKERTIAPTPHSTLISIEKK